MFAGIDPEFSVLDATQSWRMQQESMRGAIDALFEQRRQAMRGAAVGCARRGTASKPTGIANAPAPDAQATLVEAVPAPEACDYAASSRRSRAFT